MSQNVGAVHLVVEQVETVVRFLLGLEAQLVLQLPKLVRSCQAHTNLRLLPCFPSTSKVRLLPSPGVTRLPRYYEPLRLPGWLLRRPLRLASGALPRTTRLSHVALPSFSACCAHYPGGTARVHWSVASPARDGLPLSSRGSAPTSALSRLAQASLTLRPTDLLEPPTWPFVPGASSMRFSHFSPGSYLAVPTIARVDLSSTGLQRLSWRTEEYRPPYRQNVRCGSQVEHHFRRRGLAEHPSSEG